MKDKGLFGRSEDNYNLGGLLSQSAENCLREGIQATERSNFLLLVAFDFYQCYNRRQGRDKTRVRRWFKPGIFGGVGANRQCDQVEKKRLDMSGWLTYNESKYRTVGQYQYKP